MPIPSTNGGPVIASLSVRAWTSIGRVGFVVS
jgi:hypothetical protein